MSLNKDDYYLKNVELCKKLEPIMKKKGIAGDAWLLWEHDPSKASVCLYPPYAWLKSYCSTWIKPSLEAALPEWCFDLNLDQTIVRDKLPSSSFQNIPKSYQTVRNIYILARYDIKARGQESLEALAQLIILLDEENLL